MIRGERTEDIKGVAAGISNTVEVEHGGTAARARCCATRTVLGQFDTGEGGRQLKPVRKWVFLKIREAEVADQVFSAIS